MNKPKPRQGGKPGPNPIYADKIAETILERLMEGESLRSICASKGMPSRRTVMRWVDEKPDFAAKCARAREEQAHVLFEEIQAVADEGNPEDVQRAKLRVSTMQWRASKLAPKVYGDRLAIEAELPGDVTGALAEIRSLLGVARETE